MLKIFVCDDEIAHRNKLTRMITNYLLMKDYDVQFQFATDDPMMILSFISKHKTEGIYFLDIDLKTDLNGIELAKNQRLRPNSKNHFCDNLYRFSLFNFFIQSRSIRLHR